MRHAVLLMLVARAAAAEPWHATRGTLEPGVAAGSYVLASDAAPGRYAEAAMVATDEVALPYRFDITWRRLGPEAGRSMHVLVAGGVVLIKQGAIALYAYDDAAFASGEWKPLPGHLAHGEHAIRVEQTAAQITVIVDGATRVVYPLATARPSAHVGVGMKTAPGLRSAIYVRSLAVAHLQ